MGAVEFFKKKALEFQDETDNMYNVEATPAEGTAFRLARNDLKNHSNIIVAGTKERPYYTNSTNIPNDEHLSLGTQLKHQDKLQLDRSVSNLAI